MKKYLLFPHGGSGNHGCEAIVRTTTKMLEGKQVILFSNGMEEDKQYIDENLPELQKPQTEINRCSLEYMKALLFTKILHRSDAFDAASFHPVISQCDHDTVLLSIGGDNYCYGDNEHIYMVNRYARKQGAKTVLWGCSVEPKDISSKMKEDLSGYDLIVARESITYAALSEINKNVVLHPDPAFTLPVGHGVFPECSDSKPYIGINISPMIQGKERVNGITARNYEYLIDNILTKTDRNILLIPHVVWEHNDDRKPLTVLYEKYGKTGRVFFIQDQNCTQLKGIISNCEVFVGARTHATIAAYSTCVPTLVVGYSVKARGIARDLFGTEENYVLPVQELQSENDLWNAFTWIYERKNEVKLQLNEIMPKYIARAHAAGTYLNNLGD